ncbi:MAG: NUDIX domain-containing protein [Defluviitaleaceae bacterium]|nr:NUDIX domain-containing protein [Defluviitaleaceae bacterium]MCL2238567.1 NUDIX domain-containing protein [Defluviitaleaceae bacterium]
MKLRKMAGAFLTYGDEVLLIQRGLHKKLAPGMWSCIGGHIEQEEHDNPLVACFREIEEETGITCSSITGLSLRYITTRKIDDEIRTGYYFFGKTTHRCALPECAEGALHWVNISEIPNLQMTFSIKSVSTHWQNNPNCTNVFLCGINRENNKIIWTVL